MLLEQSNNNNIKNLNGNININLKDIYHSMFMLFIKQTLLLCTHEMFVNSISPVLWHGL